ncbi:MAG: hypothetical protein LIO90_08815 [Bacteroidales bacterium]|nr:hypothetical protein [Bacteroidales bacterium]
MPRIPLRQPKSLLRNLLAVAISLLLTIPTHAESPTTVKPFGALDLGLSLGTAGLGVELQTPLSRALKLRLGGDFFPHFSVPMSFDMCSYYGDGELSNTDFSKLQEMMFRMSGYEVDEVVHMDGHATMANMKLLLDIYPWADKNWYATVGFYWGRSTVGKARNTIEEMPSMVAIGIYNNMYDYFTTTDFVDTPIFNDVYIDPEVAAEIKDRFESYGRVGIHVGDFKSDGKPYIMEPGRDGLVRASLKVNSFKPYVGIGYHGAIKGYERWKIGFDAGIMIWGRPKLLTHEGVDIANDVDDIAGKVGTYVDIIKALHVYPTLNFRISYTLFK